MSEAEKTVAGDNRDGGGETKTEREAETEIEPDRAEEVGLLRPWRIPCGPKGQVRSQAHPLCDPAEGCLGPPGPWTTDQKGLKGAPWPQLLWSQTLGKGKVHTWGDRVAL